MRGRVNVYAHVLGPLLERVKAGGWTGGAEEPGDRPASPSPGALPALRVPWCLPTVPWPGDSGPVTQLPGPGCSCAANPLRWAAPGPHPQAAQPPSRSSDRIPESASLRLEARWRLGPRGSGLRAQMGAGQPGLESRTRPLSWHLKGLEGRESWTPGAGALAPPGEEAGLLPLQAFQGPGAGARPPPSGTGPGHPPSL